MMKKFILALVCLLAPFGVRAQVAVSGNLKDAGVSNITGANSFVRFTVTGFGNNIPKVIGQNIIARAFTDFHPDATGNISGSLQGNDTITPSGTSYQVCIFDNGTSFKCNTYSITGTTFNLNSATPIIVGPTNSTGFISAPRVITFVQSSPATTWTISHNFGDKNVLFNCYDTANKYLIPDTVILTSITTLTVTFTTAQAGSCTVMTAQSVSLTNAPADAVVKNSPSPQVITTTPLTIQSAFNAIGGGSMAGTFTGPSSFSSINSTVFAAGMKCDGSTNDTSALIASLGAASPGTRVAVPVGTCMVTSNISVPDGVTLQGTGTQTTTLRQISGTNDATHPLLLVSGANGNVTISELTVDGNKAGQSSGQCLIGNSQTGDMKNFTVTKSTLTNAWQAAICLAVPSPHLVRDFLVSDNNFVSNSIATTQGQDQTANWGDISIVAPFGGRIHHNSSTGSQSNFFISGTNGLNPVGHIVIDHNVVTGAMGFGVALGGGIIGNRGFGTDDVIDHNYFNMPNSRENIIDLAWWNNNLVTGNMIFSGLCDFCSGIGDAPPSTGTIISDNSIVANFTQPVPGLCIGNGGNVNITDNYCDGGGIGLQLASNTLVDGAVVEGNTVLNARPGNPGLQVLVSGGSTISNVIIKGNHFYDDQTPHTQTYGITLGVVGATTGYSNFTVEGNDVRNNLLGGILNNTVGATGMVIRGNPGFDPLTDATGGDVIGSANISQTTIYTTPPSSFLAYRVSVTGGVTTQATTSSTAPTVNITYTDADSNTARSIPVAAANPTGNSKANTTYNSSFLIYANTSTAIGFNTSGYASSGGTSMQYSLHIRIEAVQ